MSIELMTTVWKQSRHKGNKLVLLLAIADYANDQNVAWPSIGSLAEKTRMSERNVHYLLKELTEEDNPELALEENAGPHRTNLYRVLLQGANFAGCKPASKRVQNSAKRVQQFAPNPSVSVIEPSGGIASDANAPTAPAPLPSKPQPVKRQTPVQAAPPPPRAPTPEQVAADDAAWRAVEAAPPEARGRTSEDSTDPEALAAEIAQECGLNTRITRQKKAALSAAQEIHKAGATVGQVRHEFHTHWRANVYRGMCGELPRPIDVVNEWGRWEHITTPPVRPNGAQPRPAPDYEQMLREAQERTANTPPLDPTVFPPIIPAWKVLSQSA